MATFTMVLKRVITNVGGTIEYQTYTFNGVIYGKIPVMVGGDIGLSYYPIFNEEYRVVLNSKIIDHFLNREMGVETIDMFMHIVRRKMNEIMPVYNLLYESTQLDYQALSTMDLHTVTTGDNTEDTNVTGNTQSASKVDSGSRSVNSVTPQTMLAGSEDYATSAADVNSKNESDTATDQTTDQNVESKTSIDSRVTGYQGIPANLIMRYRESLINVDMMIITELEECFMQVFDNGDEYTSRHSFWY